MSSVCGFKCFSCNISSVSLQLPIPFLDCPPRSHPIQRLVWFLSWALRSFFWSSRTYFRVGSLLTIGGHRLATRSALALDLVDVVGASDFLL